MDDHPIHIHGHTFRVTGTMAGRYPYPPSGRRRRAGAVGSTRDIEFVADNPGDWAFHCHKSHHTMNAMGHGIPNTLGVDQSAGGEAESAALVPGYMPMGETGMAEHAEHAQHMPGPPNNTLP
jgi:hypothetical protein